MTTRNKRSLLGIAECLDDIVQAFAHIARWSVFVMLILGLWNVVGRYFGVLIGQNLSSNGLIEGQWYMFDIAFLLGLSWTMQQQKHVRVDVLQGRWGIRRKARLELIGILTLLLPFSLGVMIISIHPAWHSWTIGELSPDPDGLPRYWVKSLIPLGFFLLTLQGIAEGLRSYVVINDRSSSVGKFQESSISEKPLD